MKHAVVVGAGFGGLAAALRLKARGFEVTVLEQQKQLGGKATVIDSGPFRYDAGPTVVTAKVLFDELFQLYGRRPEDYVTFYPVSPWYAFDFANGSRLHYGPTYEHTEAEIERLFPQDLAGYRKFYQYSKELFEVAYEEYGCQSFDQLLVFLKATPKFIKMRCFESCSKAVSRFFSSRNLFSFEVSRPRLSFLLRCSACCCASCSMRASSRRIRSRELNRLKRRALQDL